MNRSVWVVCAFLSLSAGANAAFSKLVCNKTIVQNVEASVSGKQFRFVLRDQNAGHDALLKALLPKIPSKLLRAYGCVRYTLPMPAKLCSFDAAGDEAFRCTWTATHPVELTVEAKLSCYDKDDWDPYTFTIEAGSIEARPGGKAGEETLQFIVALQSPADKSQLALDSTEFTNHPHSVDGFRQNPECALNGRYRR